MTWEYEVATHTFTRNGEKYTANYAGATGYKNDSSQECVSGKGPLPRGTYTIGHPYNSVHTGKYTLNLTPNLSNVMCERSVFVFMVQVRNIHWIHQKAVLSLLSASKRAFGPVVTGS